MPTNDLAAKTLLARLMATEDITVEQRADAQTASFNMQTRVLTLPVWKDLDGDTLDMLIGHEVSHALYTPGGAEPLTNACKYIDPKNTMVAKDYLNVVEDARIERLIKRDYAGLRRCFANGYRALHGRDLFGIKDKKIANLPLIDRINLQYKIGWIVDVPFTATELPLVQRVATTNSWSEVVELSKAIYDLAKQQEQEKQDENEEGGEGEDGTPDDSENGQEGSKSSASSMGDENDSESSESQDGEDDGSEKTDSTDDQNSKSKKPSDGDDEGDEDENGDETESKNQEGESERSTKPNDTGDDAPAPMSQTMASASKGMSDLVDADAQDTYYAQLPEPIMDRFVVPMSKTMESLRGWAQSNESSCGRSNAVAAYNSWKSINTAAVQILATEFERRKAADEHKRTAIAETGALDPNRLHAYRIAEDIFLQNAYVKDGKNHGIILLLDMSGSMSDVFHDTMIQLVTLAHFCRRVNIPFRFYGFTDRYSRYLTEKERPTFAKNNFGNEATITRLVTLLQDGMKTTDFMETCGLLLLSSLMSGKRFDHDEHPTVKAVYENTRAQGKNFYTTGPVPWMNLDGTPTNAAMIGLPNIVNEFKASKRIQVCNVIVLTDGEATDNLINNQMGSQDYLSRPAKMDKNGNKKRALVIWQDPKTRKSYKMFTEHNSQYSGRHYSMMGASEQTPILNQILRDRTGCKIYCIHLSHLRDANSRIVSVTRDYDKSEKTYEDFKKNAYVILPAALGYDSYILMRNTTCTDEGEIKGDITAKGGLRAIRSSFSKMLGKQRANRPLLCRVADLLSK